MQAIPREDVPVVVDDNGVEIRVRLHTLDGHQDFAAGEAFYWSPGHPPEAIEDSEYVDSSPTEQFRPVVEHITSGAGASA